MIQRVAVSHGAQRPWGCIGDWGKSVSEFWDGEGGPGHAVGEHLEEYVKGGRWEGTAPERRGEGAADEKVAWWGGVEG